MMVITIVLIALVGAGCGTTIAKNLTATNDNWGIEILEITDGPDALSANTRGQPQYRSLPGYRYIWLNVKIENRGDVPGPINLEEFRIISERGTYTASWFIVDPLIRIFANKIPTLEAKETVQRRLVFNVPVGEQPDKVRAPYVGDIFIPKQSSR
jgi:hypothetical protein